MMTGTPGYMPPEAVRGGVIDAASDLYSVGCLAFELIAGRLPFAGRVIEVVRSHVNDRPPSLASLREDVPPRLQAIVEKLLAKDPEARDRQAAEVIADLAELAGLAVARENMAQKESYLRSSHLVGRERELAALDAALAEAVAGRGGACFLGAPAGVGKTRLAQEVVLVAKLKDMIVLEGQCLERGLEPYEPMAEALRPLLGLSAPEELAHVGPALSRLFPELPRRWSEVLPPVSIEAEKARLHEAIATWIRTVAERQPVVVALDDLQWADPQSLEVFNHLIVHLAGAPVFFLATLRSDELLPGSPAWLTVLDGQTQYLKLQPFGREQVGQLLEAMLRHVALDQAMRDFLYNATSGNAFYLTELLRYLMEEGLLAQRDGTWCFPADLAGLALPDSVEATVMRRLGQLSEGARRLADAASVIGRHQDLAMWLSVSEQPEERFFDHLDELIERQFVVKEDDRHTFPHDRVREALYEALPEALRRALHDRCGAFLEAAHAGSEDQAINELAHHFGQGTDARKAYLYLKRAGDQARDLGAFPVAVARWSEAEAHLQTLDYPDQEERLAALWQEIGYRGFNVLPGLAAAALEKLIGHLAAPERQGVPGNLLKQLEAYSMLGGAYGFAGLPKRGIEVAEKTIAMVPPSESPLYGALLAVFCSNLFPSGRFDALVAQAKRAAALLVDRDITGEIPLVYTTRVGAAAYQNAVSYQGIKPDAALADYAIWAAEQIQAYNLTNVTRHLMVIWDLWTGRQEAVVDYCETTAQTCRRIGAPPSPYMLYMRPYLLWQRGEFEEALAMANLSLRYAHLAQTDFMRQLTIVLRGQIHLDLGDHASAEADFAAAEARGREQDMRLILMQALLGRARSAIARGEAAEAWLAEAEAIATGPDGRNPLHEAMACRLRAEGAIACRDPLLAREQLKRALAIVTLPEQDNVIEQGRCQLLLGDLERLVGDEPKAQQAYREAASRFQAIKNRYWLQQANARLDRPVAELVVPEAPAVEQPVVPAWARDWGGGGASFRRF